MKILIETIRRKSVMLGAMLLPTALLVMSLTWYQVTLKPKCYIGDTGYETIQAAVATLGSTAGTLVLGSGTYAVSADLEINANTKVEILPGATINVTGTGTELYFGGSTRIEKGATINLASSCMVIFGRKCEIGDYQIFTGTGVADGVKFGLGPQSAVNRHFDSGDSWTPTGDGWSVAGGVAVGAAGTGTLRQTLTDYKRDAWWVRGQVVSVTSGTVNVRVGFDGTNSWSTTGWKEAFFISTYGTADGAYGIWIGGNLTGTFDNVSVRRVIGGCVEYIRPQWWGAAPGDMTVDSAPAIQYAINAASFGMTPGAAAEIPVLTGRIGICKTVNLGPGQYKVKGVIYQKAYSYVTGSPQATRLVVGTDFSGSILWHIYDTTYGGYAEGGYLSPSPLIENIEFDATDCPGDLYIFKAEAKTSGCVISRCTFRGSGTQNVWAMYFPAGYSSNGLIIRECNFYNCANPQASVVFIHDPDHQLMLLEDCTFNANCTNLIMSGANNRMRRLSFQANPALVDRVSIRGVKIVALGSGELVAGNPTVINHTTHGFVDQQKIYISGITQADWLNVNGLHLATYINANQFTIPIDTTGYAAYTDAAGTAERVGGTIFRAHSYNRHMVWEDCYFDGGGNAVDILRLGNTDVNQQGYPVVSLNCTFANRDSLVDLVTDITGTLPVPKAYAGTYVSKNSFTVVSAAGFIQNNYVWIYQDATYGYIRSQITSVVGTTITIADSILRNDTTIVVHLENTYSRKNTNIVLTVDSVYAAEE